MRSYLSMPHFMLSILLACVACKPEKPSATDRSRAARARLATATNDAAKTARESDYKSSLTAEERAVVVAKVGEVDITLGYVERYLSQQPAFVRARYRTFDQKVELLNNLIRFEILAAEAAQAGWSTDPDVVMAVKRAMVQKYLADDMQRLVVVSEISDDEVQTYYQNNQNAFITPARVRATAVVSDTEASAKAVHTELMAAIQADPQRTRVIFRDFARSRSTDKDSAWRSGDLGLFAKDGYVMGDKSGQKIPDSVVAASFDLPLNGVSEPVFAEGKWWVLQVTNRQRRTERKLDDVKREVTRFLLKKKQDAARDAFIKKLRAEAEVVVDSEVLNSLQVEKIRSSDLDTTGILPKPTASSPAKSKPAVDAPTHTSSSAQGTASPARKLLDPRAHLNPRRRPSKLTRNADTRNQGDKPTLEEIEALHQDDSEER